MTATPLLFQPKDSLTILDAESGSRGLWGVVERKRGGYLLKPFSGGDPVTWSDDQIADAYSDRRITHYPSDISGIPKDHADVLAKTWEYWPIKARMQAERRLLFVQTVDAIRNEFSDLLEACTEAVAIVFPAHLDQWTREDAELEALALVHKASRRRRKQVLPIEEQPILNHKVPTPPSPYTVRMWYLPWRAYGRDVRLLLPHTHLRGNRRPRFAVETGDKPDVYKLMDQALDRYYANIPRRSKKYAYKKYIELCADSDLEPVSAYTFRVRIKSKYTGREEYTRRYGRRAAYLKFGIFERTELPVRPLEEVEVDHCLIDLFVTHPLTGRTIGRPWLTALIDRATKVILGMHLSFEVPSYASFQRALAHALWPKDVSEIPGLDDDWPCHGIPEWIIADNGKEFRCRSIRTSEALLQFNVVNLPVKMPWLKGTVERLFQTIGVQVFNLLEGSTFSRTPDFYNPQKRARFALHEVRDMLISWVVNDYHQTEHATLKCSPIQKWRQLTDLYPVRPVPTYDNIVRLTGEVIHRKISNVGVQYEGLLYSDKDVLEMLVARQDGLGKEWLIRVDPYDLGEAWILDDEAGEWRILPCTNQSISRGVSKFQHAVHRLTASKKLPAGTRITEEDLRQARIDCVAAVDQLGQDGRKSSTMSKAARYQATGEYITALRGAPTRGAPPIIELAQSVEAGPKIEPSMVVRSPEPIDLLAEVEAMAHNWTRETL